LRTESIADELEYVWHIVPVDLQERSYEILIGPGLLLEVAKDLRKLDLAGKYFVVTDSTVKDLLGIDLLNLLDQEGLRAELLDFPAGEESKNMDTLVSLARKMVTSGADRASAIVALGGGVVGDVAAFLASIYMRGIPFVQIPTTLLAQVDSSVGGKTGVDLPEGKNLLGTFAQPKRVYADIGVLATLPLKELRNGIAEVVKYGVIRSLELFELLEKQGQDIVNLEPEIVSHVVAQSCAIKADIVAKDELEGGLRRILNFGHTIGHAIEAAANYKIAHGEAVSMGMVAAAMLSAKKGIASVDIAERIRRVLEQLGLPVKIPDSFSPQHLVKLTKHDKKSVGGKVHFVLCDAIGSTVIRDDVSDRELTEVIEECMV